MIKICLSQLDKWLQAILETQGKREGSFGKLLMFRQNDKFEDKCVRKDKCIGKIHY